MCKKFLQEDQKMSAVAKAQYMAEQLLRQETRGNGDTNNAMHRLARRYKLPYSLLWRLRYRKPKDMLLSHWTALCAAYEAECQRQAARLQHEYEITRRMREDAAAPDAFETAVAMAAPNGLAEAEEEKEGRERRSETEGG